jgi:Peptidase C10 family.
MKKFFYLLLLFLAFAINSEAKQITQKQALNVAQNALLSSDLRNSGSDLQLTQIVYDQSSLLRSTKTTLYYVYNLNEEGFIIIAGDDRAYPIIGYSFNGSYDQANLPPNFQLWMEDVANVVSRIIEEDILPSEKTQTAWESYLNGNGTNLRATQATWLIETQWNQGAPYDNDCPTIGTEKTVTGCVATTMAQLMYFHRCPSGPMENISIPGYITKTARLPLEPIDLNGVSYNWDLLQTTYYSFINASAREVAKLMLHCGVSVKMDYNTSRAGGSGAISSDMARAFCTYFGYDKGIQTKKRDYYTAANWKNLLISEINAGRPVAYSGQDTGGGGGHAFICDGYDNSNETFHFNWGWGGNSDGFFHIESSLAVSGYNFFNYNEIQIGIQPNKGGDFISNIVMGPETNNSGSPLIFGSSATQINQGEANQFIVSAPFWNIGFNTFNGDLAFVLVEQDYTFVKDLNYNISVGGGLNPGYYASVSLPCYVSNEVPDGDYLIKPAIYENDVFYIIDTPVGAIGELPLRVGAGGADIPKIKSSSLVSVYAEENQIYIDSNEIETIEIYSIEGDSLIQIEKQAGQTTVSTGSIAKGVVIVKGSSGWARKVLVK